MKKTILLIATLLVANTALYAQEKNFVLNLSDENITYNENDVWDGVYNDNALHVDGFVFSHTAPYGEGYYEGFTISRNSDNSNWYDAPGWSANQWGCMAQGGIDTLNLQNIDVPGIIGKPFLIDYYSSYSLTSYEYGTSYITLEDNNQSFVADGIYVCNHPWGYYGCISGDGFAKPLVEEGGYYKVTFNGVNIAQGTTNSVDFYLAERQYSDRNGDGTINSDDNYTNTAWRWCDLSSLGLVDVIYITMDSSDKGDFGMNTATIVCLDGLRASIPNSINSTSKENEIYASNGYIYITAEEEQTIGIYNLSGSSIANYTISAGRHMIDCSHLPGGVYLVRSKNAIRKVII